MLAWHRADDLGDQRLTSVKECLQREGFLSHPLETTRKFFFDGLTCRSQDIRHRTVMAKDVHDECLSEFVRDPFVREKIANVEKVSRMLPV